MPKTTPPAKETVADLLAELASVYGLPPVDPDEITVEMLIAESGGTIVTRMAATRILAQAVKDKRLAEPVEKMGPNGRRLKAWRRLK